MTWIEADATNWQKRCGEMERAAEEMAQDLLELVQVHSQVLCDMVDEAMSNNGNYILDNLNTKDLPALSVAEPKCGINVVRLMVNGMVGKRLTYKELTA